jgi:hypothetical protein
MTSAFHMAMCHTVPRPVPFIWQCVIRYHNQCNMTMRHTVPRPVQHDNAPYGNTNSVFHMAICHTLPRPVSFTWRCVIRYHDQRLSHGTKVESSTPNSDELYFFSDLECSLIFSGNSFWKTILKRKIKKKSGNKNGNLYKARECYRCYRRHVYQVVSV